MNDRRKKNANWLLNILESGKVSTEDAQLAVLMDIRDELQELNRKLDGKKFQVPKMSIIARRRWLKEFVSKHRIKGTEEYLVLEAHALHLKAIGFYSETSVNADIVHRLKKAANGGAL